MRGVQVFEDVEVTGFELKDGAVAGKLATPYNSTSSEVPRFRLPVREAWAAGWWMVATGVKTNHGDIVCDHVVNCGGQWARQ